jgi:tRNA threonylcarbamoyladenosine biosynthesis protein TsaB
MTMRVLAFDCCLRSVSVTMFDGARVFTRREAADQGGQAERLMPLIEATRGDAGLAWAQIERIAVTCGPGGFTSVRVGIAAARALALGLNVPAVGETSLDALVATALALPANSRDAAVPGRLVTVIPAGRDGIYHRAYDRSGTPLTSACVVEAADLATAATAGDTLIGPGSQIVQTALSAHAGSLAGVYDTLEVSTELLARRAHLLTTTAELRPVYLRAADAKPQMGKRLARA